jgi:serine/threonine protein phosphatase 1
MRRLAIGDIHGNYRAMLQCLDRCHFDPQNDLLIGLGDYCDGHSQTAEVLLLLNKIPHKVLVTGNHDQWFINFLKTGGTPNIWTKQGGLATIKSIQGHDLKVFDKVLGQCVPYYLTDDNKIFVHGGVDFALPVNEQNADNNIWDRNLYSTMVRKRDKITKVISPYDEIYVGHTDTTGDGYSEPFYGCGLWNLDQGAGYKGKLTIMDVDTKEFWQSDKAEELYPEKGER